jgi:hypothetical protein
MASPMNRTEDDYALLNAWCSFLYFPSLSTPLNWLHKWYGLRQNRQLCVGVLRQHITDGCYTPYHTSKPIKGCVKF